MQSTPWGCFVTITSKSLYRFVINGAEQALLFSLPEKGWQVLFCSFSYDLLNNCRVFSLFLLFKDNNQRWCIFNNFHVIFYLWSLFLTLLVSVFLYAGTYWVSGISTLYVCFILWRRLWEGQEMNSFLLTKQGWKQPAFMIFLLNGSQKVEILLTKHKNYYFANKHASIKWRKRA